MKNCIAIVFVLMLFSGMLRAQKDYQALSEERTRMFNQYDRDRLRFREDTLDPKTEDRIKAMEELIEKDNELLDELISRMGNSSQDSMVRVQQAGRIDALAKDNTSLSGERDFFRLLTLLTAGAALLIMIILLVLFFKARRRALRSEHTADIEKQRNLAALKEASDATARIKELEDSFRREYQTLKDVGNVEIRKHIEIENELTEMMESLREENEHLHHLIASDDEEKKKLRSELEELKKSLPGQRPESV